MVLQTVRGTHDLLPDDFLRHGHVKDQAFKVAERFGFSGIDTPIFEFLEVFSRTLGDSSDIVNKEMYVFEDRGGEKLALRPEGTAAVVRMLISQSLQQNMPLKVCYAGPYFRYERPQKGRQRQFHQFGVELFGVSSFRADVEVILLGVQLLKSLGIFSKTHLSLNSIGDFESRLSYKNALVTYLERFKNDLSDDSKVRLTKNPLRILDSKNEGDQKILEGAPLLHDHLNAESKIFFENIVMSLDAENIPYTIDQRLVRGLDYYNHTVFEFLTTHLGTQGAVLSGGRYDGLVKSMGGLDLPSVGFGAGIERLALLLENAPETRRPISIVPLNEEDDQSAWSLAFALREDGIIIDMAYQGNISKRLKKASKVNSKYCIILGGDEKNKGEALIKNMDLNLQEAVDLNELKNKVKALWHNAI